MSKLVIINGSSGAGKTYFLENISNIENTEHDLVAIKKFTTRSPRGSENMETSCDLHFHCERLKIESMKYHYQFKDEWYGFDETEIEDVLGKGKYPCIIIRNYPVLIDLRKHYGKQSLAFYIQGAYSGGDLESLLLRQGRSKQAAREAVINEKLNFNEYYHYMTQDLFDDMHLFDAFIINYYDERFLGQFEYHIRVDKKRHSMEVRGK
jgi:guanylate kinase